MLLAPDARALPVGITRVDIYPSPTTPVPAAAQADQARLIWAELVRGIDQEEGSHITGDVSLLDAQGHVVKRFVGMRCQQLPGLPTSGEVCVRMETG